MHTHAPSSRPQSVPELHAVFGSGGTQALLAGTGGILAFHVGEMTEWTSVGGASAGSMPAAMLASGKHPREFLRHVVDTDFQSLLKRKTSWLGIVVAMLRKYHYERIRATEGVFDPTGMRDFMDKIIPSWPAPYWTVAACQHGQVLFTADGVFKYGPEYWGEQLSSQPPSVGTAVHGSCAIPGILDSLCFGGEYLFDGALSGDGDVPVNVVWRHFPTSDNARVLAIDVGEDPVKQWRPLRFLWKVFCYGQCGPIDGVRPTPRPGLIVVSPRLTGFHSLQFTLPKETKWKAILAGFQATAQAIEANSLVNETATDRLRYFSAAFKQLQEQELPAEQFVRQVEDFLSRHDLFA